MNALIWHFFQKAVWGWKWSLALGLFYACLFYQPLAGSYDDPFLILTLLIPFFFGGVLGHLVINSMKEDLRFYLPMPIPRIHLCIGVFGAVALIFLIFMVPAAVVLVARGGWCLLANSIFVFIAAGLLLSYMDAGVSPHRIMTLTLTEGVLVIIAAVGPVVSYYIFVPAPSYFNSVLPAVSAILVSLVVFCFEIRSFCRMEIVSDDSKTATGRGGVNSNLDSPDFIGMEFPIL
jgi:hypothetical protein